MDPVTRPKGIVRANSARVFEPVRGAVAYLDTLQIRCRGHVSSTFLDELREHAGCEGAREHTDPVRVKRSRLDGSRVVTVDQPQPRALAMFAERESYGAVVRRLDLAVDYVVSDERTARKLLKQVAYRLSPPHERRSPKWVPRRSPTPTFYLGPRGAPRVWAVYGDRVSKIDGSACVHVELRVSGPRTVERFVRSKYRKRRVHLQLRKCGPRGVERFVRWRLRLQGFPGSTLRTQGDMRRKLRVRRKWRVRPHELLTLNPREVLDGLLRFAEVDSTTDPRRVALAAHAAQRALFDSVNDGPRLPVTAWRSMHWRKPFRDAYVIQSPAPFDVPEKLSFPPHTTRAGARACAGVGVLTLY